MPAHAAVPDPECIQLKQRAAMWMDILLFFVVLVPLVSWSSILASRSSAPLQQVEGLSATAQPEDL
jgi:hypothetical protein